jgi:hypothetical protein
MERLSITAESDSLVAATFFSGAVKHVIRYVFTSESGASRIDDMSGGSGADAWDLRRIIAPAKKKEIGAAVMRAPPTIRIPAFPARTGFAGAYGSPWRSVSALHVGLAHPFQTVPLNQPDGTLEGRPDITGQRIERGFHLVIQKLDRPTHNQYIPFLV